MLVRILGALMVLVVAGPAIAADPVPANQLRVAVYDVEPYGMQGRDGRFSGASVDLWRRVAEQLDRPYQLKLVPQMEALLAGLQKGEYDLAIGAITITPDRLAQVDFSYPAHRSGVAVVFAKQTGVIAALKDYRDALADLGPLLIGIVVFLAVTGVIMWWFERAPANAGHSDQAVTTWHEGVYWAVVTMTTVGYGDKAPKTTAGRVIAMIWMIASLVIVSLLTTTLVARITVNQVDGSSAARISDLAGKRVAAVTDSSGAEFLDEQRLGYQKFANLPGALDALAAGKLDAVVNSVGALRYLVNKRFADKIELPNGVLAPAYMAFALPMNSPLRRPLDRALAIVTASPDWQAVEDTYFAR
jgi:polar amino acid transport system substrate-binding protein